MGRLERFAWKGRCETELTDQRMKCSINYLIGSLILTFIWYYCLWILFRSAR